MIGPVITFKSWSSLFNIMSLKNYDIDEMANILKVLGDPTRLHILKLISERELCVCEISSILDLSQSNVSQHLAKLRSVNLVRERKRAQWVYYSLNPEPFPLLLEILRNLPDVSVELKRGERVAENNRCKI
ncbi:putative arsenical resistance operon repressor ArsR2 [Metallosphaera sp. J1]|uniref:ArsR/SmtB family transcription factor n=1 Tax=Metallosphaera javensis (ex Hofmann et al. 2022) TaxID=99938 RepID=UPI001EDF5245|nr:metalloregulator ArsR/SmtB family transcription factor [Metallosphaera javensis (ex Hofmann et al. 2022)]MCG3109100.1 putative arsenical resistance operon repressor ArsR2 [Metallosphaera javensis (ex Hofmann et al. 2022)]